MTQYRTRNDVSVRNRGDHATIQKANGTFICIHERDFEQLFETIPEAEAITQTTAKSDSTIERTDEVRTPKEQTTMTRYRTKSGGFQATRTKSGYTAELPNGMSFTLCDRNFEDLFEPIPEGRSYAYAAFAYSNEGKTVMILGTAMARSWQEALGYALEAIEAECPRNKGCHGHRVEVLPL